MNNLGALGVVVMTYEQNTNDDTILYSLDDDESDLYNVNMQHEMNFRLRFLPFPFRKGVVNRFSRSAD